ncbi:MFS transporter, partial [Crossiella equi]
MRTLAVLATGAGVFALLQSLIAPVLTTIQHDLGTTQSTVTWLLTAYLLSAAVFTPVVGRLGDMLGKRRVLVASLLALALGCLVAALADSIEVLIAARVVQGMGGAVFPLSFGVLRDEFPRERLGSAVGTLSAVIAVGSGLGVALAGPIVATLGSRWLFWLPFLVVSATALAAFRYVPESPSRAPGRINWLAAALLSGWLVALLLGVSRGSAWGWTSPWTLGSLGIGVLLLAVWIAVEARAHTPLIDLRMLRLPAVWPTNTVSLLFGAAMFAAWAFVPQLVQAPLSTGYGFGGSASTGGWLMLPMVVTMFVMSLASGRLAVLVGYRAQLVGGAVFAALACLSLALAHAALWQIAVGTALLGTGIGLAFAAMANLVVEAVPPSQTSVASGMNLNVRTIGGAVGAAVMTSVVTAQVGPAGLPLESGYTTGFAVFAGIGALAATAALL